MFLFLLLPMPVPLSLPSTRGRSGSARGKLMTEFGRWKKEGREGEFYLDLNEGKGGRKEGEEKKL